MFPIQSTASNTKRKGKIQTVNPTSGISKSDLTHEPTDSKTHMSHPLW